MNEITTFAFDGAQVRTITIDAEPWFIGKDVAGILGYENPTKAIRDHVDVEDKKVGVQNVTPSITDSMGRKQYPTLINESGLYALILSSKLPTAKRFKRWVTSEVLPKIRRTGMYATEQLLDDPDLAIKAFTALKEEREKRKALELENQAMQPKALFADAVSASETSILVGDLAKVLRQNGVEVGQKRLFQKLRDEGYLIKRKGCDWNMPTQRSMEAGWFEVKESTHQSPDGTVRITKTPKVTGKGQVYFINKFLPEEKANANT